MNRTRLAALSAGAMYLAASMFVPAVATADTGGTNSIKVLNAPTYNPGTSSGSFVVHVVGNGSTTVKGASTGLQFDPTKLTLTALTDAGPTGVSQVGWPLVDPDPLLDEMTAAIAAMNTGGTVLIGGVPSVIAAGHIPNMGWFTTGAAKAANTDLGLFDATFRIKAYGNSTLHVEADPIFGGILDGDGLGLPLTTVDGNVTNPAPPPTPPKASMTALAAWAATNAMTVRWGATAGTNPVASYDVRYRAAAYNGTYGAYAAWKNATAATSAAFTTSPGYTYCFSVRARDTMATVSGYSAETCTAAPLDDRSLARSGSWTVGTGSAYYRSTYVRATSTSAALTRTGAKAKRIALVVTTCATCGSVKVYWGSTLLKIISLRSATTVNKKLITVVAWTSVKSGTLVLRPGTSGRATIIDGVVLSKY